MQESSKNKRDNVFNSKQGKNRKKQSKWRIVALVLLPVLFCIFASAVLYLALEPFIGHYSSAAMLFVGNEPLDRQTRNLFEGSQPEHDPVDWVDIDDHFAPPDDEVQIISRSDITMPQLGDRFAHITISGTEVDAPVFWGDRDSELNQGVGTSIHGWLPGFGRTVLMKAHRHTDFSDLGSTEIGSVVTIYTHYGDYTYEVVDIAILHKNDKSAFDLLRDDENLILYTCYPLDGIGTANYRFFVYADPLTGTPVSRYT